MSDQLLVSVLNVNALAAGASVAVAHGLKSNGKPVAPTQVVCVKGSAIRVSASDTSTVTFTNDALVAASATFRVEHDHTIHAPMDVTPTVYGGIDTSALAPVDHLDFVQTPAAPRTDRRLQWNDTDGTLDLGLKGGAVTLQMGQEQVIRIYNATGADLLEGQVVYQDGSTGTRLTADLALADSDATSVTILGVVTEPIPKLSYGFVTTWGLVRDIDTNHLDEGKPVYLDWTVPGLTTKTVPVAPAHTVLVGYCVRKHPTEGSIFVHTQNGYELMELHDVLATSPRTGDTLIYNATTGIWTEGQPLWVSQTQTPLELQAGEQATVNDTVYQPIVKKGGAAGDITLAANPIESLTASAYGREIWLHNVDVTRSIILPAGGNTLLSGGVNLTLAPGAIAKFMWVALGGGKWLQHASAVTAS